MKYKQKRCYTTHTPIKVEKGILYGGSCSAPIEHCDVYVGLTNGMVKYDKHYPWVKGEAFSYPIKDYSAPDETMVFMKLINYLCNQLQLGKKVHVGCFGGHGRTGLVLAAIMSKQGYTDAIQWVRTHYCHKAVESQEQVDFLVKYFNAKPAPAAKQRLQSVNKYAAWEGAYRKQKVKTKYVARPKGKGGIWGDLIKE